ncbi:MAG TPA: LacI family DNA-binding transcriptional regulator [Gaiellaceae bacterium]|nr:LacI family DNA-binding transcriptional regulator [Gaiellaceae bacterium]
MVTLADVAKHAGVSASTASRALNGRGEMFPETRAAVLEAADALQFEPSLLARSLRTRTTWTVGFVVPDVSSPFYASALKGAQTALEEAGYRVMLMDSRQDPGGELAALRTLLNHQVDGLLLSTVGINRKQFRATVERRGTPCVFFDSVVPRAGEGSVLLDNAAGIEHLVDHLVGHGHRRIALLTGSLVETSGHERLDAFRAAMARHGLDVLDAHLRGGRWSSDAGREGTLELLAADPRVTAIVASSVELALGCMFACRERSVRIPDDLALAAFDDAYFAELLDPSLTAVAYDPAEVGSAATALLVEAMQHGNATRRELKVPVNLVTRESCGCTP